MADEPSSTEFPEAPVLVVQTRERVYRLRAGGQYNVGRDPAADIVVTDPRVSAVHAVLERGSNGWEIEDAGSRNGIYFDGKRVERMVIDRDETFQLGHARDGEQLTCSVEAPPGHETDGGPGGDTMIVPDPGYQLDDEATVTKFVTGERAIARPLAPSADPSSVVKITSSPLRIGRAADNDIVVSDLMVSRHHAELRTIGDGKYRIVDLGSHNGTYVNGSRVDAADLSESDLISMGHTTARLVGDELREYVDTGDVSVSVQNLIVRTGEGKVILDGVSFPIPHRSLVGVIGPSGAGKSTLLGAVTGLRPATEGTVRYDGRDLYTNYDELRHRIGLVPQEDILHNQLQTRRALLYAAELRFPGDTRREEREQRVDEVLEELGLARHADTRIDRLSGGQRKRVNVALELLTKPSLLFLDEPTSGLDPGLDKTVMEMLSELAHDGRTVIVVTHSVANLDACDRLLVLVPGGRLAYYGPPADGLRHFGQRSWAEVFQAFEREAERDWAGEFRDSPYFQQYVAVGLTDEVGPPEVRRPEPPPAPQSKLSQLSTLCRRYLAVIASDRSYLALLGVMPVLLGGLIAAVPPGQGFAGAPGTNTDAPTKLMILMFAACFVGTGNSIREIVKEQTIYGRERAAGLSAGVYLMSKMLVLGVITTIQAVVLVSIGTIGVDMPPKGLFTSVLVELILAMALLGITSLALGLLVSVSVNTSEKTLPLLIVLSMAQLVLTGGLVRLPGTPVLEQLSYISPSRWGYAAGASTLDLDTLSPHEGAVDPLWKHSIGTWLVDMGVVAALGIVFLTLAWYRLYQMRPRRRGARPARI
ncbi:ABC-type multidrug transport system, ATPase component [Nocardia amikacinitolerans]|uniref:FHA domain-containing protein n=1 Tax=Nocardia amikacinitolerans TaxID=756689 RepID=UPI00083594D0|nr:FHA domain-containing protein [Nocardia amikacinitolerans]MCP2317811.1 ABC-type multidrug transport system, ATPase component [Nocardia amikacinitolerans]